MRCRISLCYNFGLRQVEGKVDKVRALSVCVCGRVSLKTVAGMMGERPKHPE